MSVWKQSLALSKQTQATGMKQFSTRVARPCKGAKSEIKRNQQHLTRARPRDRYNRLGSSFYCGVENWMWFSHRSVANHIFMGTSLYCLLHNSMCSHQVIFDGKPVYCAMLLLWKTSIMSNLRPLYSWKYARLLHTFPAFFICGRMQSAHWPLLICCKQILEMEYE